MKEKREKCGPGGCKGQGCPAHQASLAFISRERDEFRVYFPSQGKVQSLFIEKGTSLEFIFRGREKV